MTHPSQENREALPRALFFLRLARACKMRERAEHEAYLEASLVFARAELHRLSKKYARKDGWKAWMAHVEKDSSATFLAYHRNFILKEGSARVNQIMRFEPVPLAEMFYYFDDPQIPAAQTVEGHLNRLFEICEEADSKFG